MGSVIHRVTTLTETEGGASCVMQIVGDLQGDGVVGDNQLEGNEESLINDSQEITVDQMRNGAKSKGTMSEQQTVIRFRAQAKDKLTFWLSDKIDELMFLTASGRAYSLNTNGSARGTSQLTQLKFAADVVAASSNRIKYAGSATSEGTLTTSDTMGWNFLVGVSSFAKRKRIRPIRSGGKDFFAVVMSTEQARDLKQDTNYQTNVRTAAPRSDKNPLFTGAFAVVDGLILYEHNKVFNTQGLTTTNKWGSSGTVDGAQALLMGAQALGLATIGSSSMNESDNTDYKNRAGIAYGRKIGMLKPQFITPNIDETGAEDYGIVSIKTAAAAA
jgi:N4-gp56 family major capsid protein